MASASLGNGGVGSSRSVNGFKSSSNSVDWLGREMLEMRLRDNSDHDEDRVRNFLHVTCFSACLLPCNVLSLFFPFCCDEQFIS